VPTELLLPAARLLLLIIDFNTAALVEPHLLVKARMTGPNNIRSCKLVLLQLRQLQFCLGYNTTVLKPQ
jgi:hypothetical protein